MFVFSVKTEKKKVIILLAAMLLVIVSISAAVRLYGQTTSGGSTARQASTNEDRVAFLARYGWKVDTEPLEIREVTIPLNFNDVYGEYNKIQKAQGMDLLPYAGKRCKQWVYCVTNHPKGDARANLLVYNNVVIGGDISSTALDGFMTGFQGDSNTMTVSSAGSAAPASSVPASSAPATSSSASSASASSTVKTQAKVIPDDAWPTD